jgi:ABC-type lipoprotein release transport system permease subunit
MYIAGGIMSGVVTVIVLLLIIMIFRNRTKSEMVQLSSAFPVSDIRVRKSKGESPMLVHDAKQKHDEILKTIKSSALVHGSKLRRKLKSTAVLVVIVGQHG